MPKSPKQETAKMEPSPQPTDPVPDQNQNNQWWLRDVINVFKKHHAVAGLSVAGLVIVASAAYVGFAKNGNNQTSDFSKVISAPNTKSHNVIPAKIDASTQAAQDNWNQSYRYIFVKPDANLDQAVADASSHGVTVVSTLKGIHAYVATQATADSAKNLPETQTANPIIGSPAVIPDGSDVVTATTTIAPPVNKTPPTITGSLTSGGTAVTNNGTWTATYSLSYREAWYVCATSSAASCQVRTDGGNNASYAIPAGNNGKYLEVTVKACVIGTTACAGPVPSTLYLISATASPPPPPPTSSVPVNTSTPLLSGSFQSGNTITTTTGGWTNSPTSYKYNWYICASSASCTLKASGSVASYSIPSGSGGQYLKSGVTGCNSAGCGTEAASALYSISNPASPPPPPTPPTPPTPPPPPPQQTCSGSGSQEISASLVRINARTDKTKSGDGCNSVGGVVGVIDSGITSDPDLNVIGGKNFVNADGNCNSTATTYADDNGHGTQVASIIGSKDDTQEFVGVAPGIGLMALKTQDSTGSGTFQALVCAVNYAITTRSDSDPNNNIAVINMSLAGTTTDPTTATCSNTNEALHLAICAAERAGIVFAVAAGNSSQDFNTTYPATYPEVLTATAMNDYNGSPGGGASQSCTANDGADDTYASYSNYPDSGEMSHTVTAPGTCVHSLTPSNPTYSWWSGTSEASPMVAGLLANCIYWGSCSGTAAQIQSKVYNDVYSYASANQSYGYVGDPWHAASNGHIYGPLINLALY